MPQKGLTRWQKATALVPLALLSGAWTTSLTLTNTASAESTQQSQGTLPDGTSVPNQAIKAPASVSQPGEIAPGVLAGSADKVIKGAAANGIPAAALSAYQRAAQVIDTADKSCHLDWTLIAAIGRVESNHGRYGGNTLDSNGVARPGIFGIPLDGRNGTSTVLDTDGGRYDHDKKYDRAVGPLQFIPSTWAVIGVDGDGDGKRNPQDIDDAALATAVYLCSGNQDLSTSSGQHSAVYRYNHSNDYVNLVLSIMRAYSRGDYSSVPTSSAGTTTMTPDYGDSVMASGTSGYQYPQGQGFGSGGFSGGGGSGGGGSTAGSTSSGSSSSRSTTGSGQSGGSSQSGGTSSSAPSVPTPTKAPSSDPSRAVGGAVKKVTKPVTKPVKKVLITSAQATTMCTNELKSSFGDAPADAVSQCAKVLMGKTVPEAQASVAGVVAGLKGLVCGGLIKLPGC